MTMLRSCYVYIMMSTQVLCFPLLFTHVCCRFDSQLFSLTAYIISDLWRLLLPVLVVLDVPPLDLQGGGGARPAEGTRHLHILAAPCCDVAWHLGKESWKRRKKEGLEGRRLSPSICDLCHPGRCKLSFIGAEFGGAVKPPSPAGGVIMDGKENKDGSFFLQVCTRPGTEWNL